LKSKKKASKRDRTIRLGAIALVVALLLSLLAGAISFTPTQAAEPDSVQVSAAEPALVDTDKDGIENNEDPDVDGDGIVNGEDEDIDGDGIENFEDADPIDTTDIDSNAPQKPIRPNGNGNNFNPIKLVIFGAILLLTLGFGANRIGIFTGKKDL